MTTKKLDELLDSENVQLQKLNEIVQKAIDEEKIISDKLIEFEETNPSLSSRIADSISSFGGSWKFILSFVIFMITWMLINLYLLSKPFDPFPFILLNLILSAIAAIQAPVIMMSQNRKGRKGPETSC